MCAEVGFDILPLFVSQRVWFESTNKSIDSKKGKINTMNQRKRAVTRSRVQGPVLIEIKIGGKNVPVQGPI